MTIDASVVATTFRLLLGQTMNDADAMALAVTLGSREELLAYLMTRTDFLGEHPDAREELLRVAAQYGLEAETRRSGFGPTATMHSLSKALHSEIIKVVAEAAQFGSASPMDNLVHRLNQLGCFPDPRPGFSPERWIKP